MAEALSARLFDMPPLGAGFPARGAWLIRSLMYDLDLSAIQAASAVGNLGGESGLKAVNEEAPMVPGSAGGFGWAQWTGEGPGGRRTDFMNWCHQAGLSPTQDEANYGFLLEELRGSHAHDLKQLKETSTIPAGVFTFEYFYERPSDMYSDLPRRERLAQQALDAFNQPAQVPPRPTTRLSPQQMMPPNLPPERMPVPIGSIPPTPSVEILPPPIIAPTKVSAGSATIVTMASGGIAGFIVGTIYLLAVRSGVDLPEWWYLALYAALHTLGAWFGHSRALQIAQAAEDKLLARLRT